MTAKEMTPHQKAAQTRRWNRVLAKCTHNDREELIAFREFLAEARGLMDAAWMERWGEYCNFTEEEKKQIAAKAVTPKT